ncbi:MAG: TIGR03936 family radical SAM-associated protein [Oscillospiraceae bacterium]|nr:TIGR03936 family radical SAM-associated protein [Oscillospiraceae bacterium]
MPDTIRLLFSKTGRARFISHLDLMAVFQRAFYRAGLPLRYSQGFSPRVYLSIPLPLSVGYAGLREPLDVGAEAPVPGLDALPERLNALLPEGISVLSAEMNGRSPGDIVWARYEVRFHTGAEPEAFLSLFAAPLVVEKRTKKKGAVPTDLLPMVRAFSCARSEPEDGTLCAKLELAAQNPTLNPGYITAEFERRMGLMVPAEVTRLGFLDAAGAEL